MGRKPVIIGEERTTPLQPPSQPLPSEHKAPPKSKKGLKPYKEPTTCRFHAKSINDVLSAIPYVDTDPMERGYQRILERKRFIRPGFSPYWLYLEVPPRAKKVAEYTVLGAKVRIYDVAESDEGLYYLMPREYQYPPGIMKVIHSAMEGIAKHYPKGVDLENLAETRGYINRITASILRRTAAKAQVSLDLEGMGEEATIEELSECISRYSGGFGMLEYVLSDKNVEDIYVDAPNKDRIYLNLSTRHNQDLPPRVKTNIMPTPEECENLLSKIRYESGRPFSEAMPVLEYDLDDYGARVTVIGKPLSPYGIAMTLRKHSKEPWTLLHLINNGTLSPLAAGLISFLVEGRTTILVAGSRGAGKTSFLGAMMLEFPLDQRILTIEDTLELPTNAMKEYNYNVQNIYVKPGMGEAMMGLTYEDAIRVSLRLGESALVLGEVRGPETRYLYEAMRAGTAGSTVMGTFHADSPKAVYDRVVNDIGIPPRSFSATDIIVMVGVVQRGARRMRKLTHVSEVIKEKDGEFRDLFVLDLKSKRLEATPTQDFYYGSEKIGAIARAMGMGLEEAIEHIKLGGKVREISVDYAKKHDKPELLGIGWVTRSNKAFRYIYRQCLEKEGHAPADMILKQWKEWFRKNVSYV